MNTRPYRSSRTRAGLTLLEAVFCLAMLAAIYVFFVHPVRVMKHRKSPDRVCLNNLKNIGLGFGIFAQDNDGNFPMELTIAQGGSREFQDSPKDVWRHFTVLSNELSTPKIALCPRDVKGRKEARSFSPLPMTPGAAAFTGNENVSYFVGVDAVKDRPSMLLAGDRNLTNREPSEFRYGLARVGNLGTNHTHRQGAGWDENVHSFSGSVAQADGSVLRYSAPSLRAVLRFGSDTNNRIAVPD